MLQYLVTSKARRRLLGLLWADRAHGTASELAALASVSFAATHGELKAMTRAGLAVASVESGRERYAANLDHPGAKTVLDLVASEASVPPYASSDDLAVKQGLVALGAPLRGVPAVDVPASQRMAMLVRGVGLARRDPVVARSLPLCIWKQRAVLDVKALAQLAPRAEDKHALGFFIALAGELGGDRRLGGLAEQLRDRRMTSVRDFFLGASLRRAVFREFSLAAEWGFRMNTDLESFKTLFDKFVSR